MAARFQVCVFSLFIYFLSARPVTSQYDPSSHQGTTKNIQQVFQGRCWDYDITKYISDLPRVETGCEELWDLFFKSFSYRPPCAVNMDTYMAFLKAARQQVPENKVLFWSGVFSLAHRYGADGDRYVTLEDTLVGYLASSITWCGQSTEPGMNITRCPAWDDCPMEAAESFWAGASKMFAMQAKGNVMLMLDGSNPDKPAYRRSSFFGKYELLNLGDAVTSVTVLVSHVLDKPKLEVCGKGSLADLEMDVKKIGKTYKCVDDPLAVMHLLCADNPRSRECQLVGQHRAGTLMHKKTPPAFNQMPDRFS